MCTLRITAVNSSPENIYVSYIKIRNKVVESYPFLDHDDMRC